jgi:RecB family exonuclease
VAERADDHDVLAAATASVRAGAAVLREIGEVILHLPRRLRREELELLRAFADRDALWAIAGDAAIAGELDPLLGPADERPVLAAPDARRTTIVRAPDAAEEVRIAVRAVTEHLRRGVPADRIAIVSRVGSPYALLAHEELEAAGISHSAQAPLALAQGIAGRTLLGLLAWRANGHRRDELMRLLRGARLLDPAGGWARPDRWDRLARRAGVVGGLDQWKRRLDEATRERLEHLTATLRDGGATSSLPFDGAPSDIDDRVAELSALGAFVARLGADTDPGAREGWRSLTSWAANLLRKYLGNDSITSSWPESEQHARAGVLDVLSQLAALDGIGPPPTVDEFTDMVAFELDRAAGRVGRFGHGVFVGRLVDAVGADFDLVVVVGAAEGLFPPRARDDTLLPERIRLAAGSALRPRGSTVEEEMRDIGAVLAAAPTVVVTHPAADSRNQRAQQPAACLHNLAAERIDVASFEWWLAAGRDPSTPAEFDIAELIRARVADQEVSSLPVVRAAGLERGLVAANARAAGELGPWSGAVGRWTELADSLAHPRSPTGLQEWAKCPFSYFLDKVLGLRELDDPGDVETISPVDRGSLVHAILEVFFSQRLGQRPATGWTIADHDELLAVADEVEAVFRARGVTGRPLLWQAEWAALRRHLGRILDADNRDERLQGLSPATVEHGFGFEGDAGAPVHVDLGNGRTLNFGGRVDRIDRSPDGRRLVVLDYKTGSAWPYAVIDADHADHDIVARGQYLQLPIYALAAHAEFPEAERIEAYYWFIGQRGKIEMKGGVIDDVAAARFDHVVRTIVDGIEEGLFPARPGNDDWRPSTGPTYQNCFFCAFNELCPSARGEQWLALRERPELQAYVELAEG